MVNLKYFSQIGDVFTKLGKLLYLEKTVLGFFELF